MRSEPLCTMAFCAQMASVEVHLLVTFLSDGAPDGRMGIVTASALPAIKRGYVTFFGSLTH